MYKYIHIFLDIKQREYSLGARVREYSGSPYIMFAVLPPPLPPRKSLCLSVSLSRNAVDQSPEKSNSVIRGGKPVRGYP